MNKEERMQAWETRKNAYANQWQTGLCGAPCESPGFCCLALCCPTCVSYYLRKRSLRGDLSRYLCCNGYMPCSGKCGERSCPELCLCLEVCCCFGTSVAVTRWMVQDEMHIQNSSCDNCLMGTMLFLQQLACICQIAACLSGSDELQQLADLITFIADIFWASVCACMQTQHKIQIDERDKGGAPAGAPPPPIHAAPPPIGPPQAAPPNAYPGYAAQGAPGYPAAAPPDGYPGGQMAAYPGQPQGYPAPAQPMYDRYPGAQQGYPGAQQGMYR